jgi:hypothetical protein
MINGKNMEISGFGLFEDIILLRCWVKRHEEY